MPAYIANVGTGVHAYFMVIAADKDHARYKVSQKFGDKLCTKEKVDIIGTADSTVDKAEDSEDQIYRFG